MPHTIPPIKSVIKAPEAKTGAKKVVLPAKARLGAKMSADILNALEQKPFALDVHLERVAALRKNARKAAPALGRAFHALDRERFHERFALVNLLNELDDEAALPELVRIVETPAGKSAASGQSLLVEKQRDTMVRTLAVEGLGQLARKGNQQAVATLENQLHHPSFSVRRAAVQALLELGEPDQRAKMRAALPEKEHFLLDIKVMDPRDILRKARPFSLPKGAGDPAPVLPLPKTHRPPLETAPKADLYPAARPPKTPKTEGN